VNETWQEFPCSFRPNTKHIKNFGETVPLLDSKLQTPTYSDIFTRLTHRGVGASRAAPALGEVLQHERSFPRKSEAAAPFLGEFWVLQKAVLCWVLTIAHPYPMLSNQVMHGSRPPTNYKFMWYGGGRGGARPVDNIIQCWHLSPRFAALMVRMKRKSRSTMVRKLTGALRDELFGVYSLCI
jgi:hypothetical protein